MTAFTIQHVSATQSAATFITYFESRRGRITVFTTSDDLALALLAVSRGLFGYELPRSAFALLSLDHALRTPAIHKEIIVLNALSVIRVLGRFRQSIVVILKQKDQLIGAFWVQAVLHESSGVLCDRDIG